MYTDQMQLFDLELRAGCVRQEIGTCLAPCLSTCSRQRYGEQVEKAIHFLNGMSVEVLGLVEQQMNKAAAGQHFEHAARMRDDFKILKWLSNRLASFKRAREQYSFIYSVKGCDGRDIWYLIRKGGIEHAIAMPKNASHWRSARTALSRWHESNESVGAGFLRYEETIGLVTTWFQKNRDELRETKSVAEIPARWSEMQISMNQRQLTVG